MATNNAVNVGLSGSTGTGNFVGSTSPTLVTPTLGAASATSINFGGSTLNTYTQASTWTPVLSFATPGNVSVVYNTQTGYYSRIGNIVSAHFILSCTPTFTTATGNLQISGLPVALNSNVYAFGNCLFQSSNFPAGVNSIFLQGVNSASYMVIGLNGSGVAAAYFTTTQCTSGAALNIQGSLTYLA